MRTTSITGALLFCLLCLGCGDVEEFNKTLQNREQYVRNWSIAQENLKQAPQDSDQTQQDTNQTQQEQILQDPNESRQEWGWPPEVFIPTQPEIYTTDIDIRTVKIPIESKIEYIGYYGCIAPVPYEITIHQKLDDVVIIKKIRSRTESKEYCLHINKFKVFWKYFSLFDIMSFSESYGEMWSTADFRGDLTIDIVTAEGKLNKKIHIIGDKINDNEFHKLLYIIRWLIDENAHDSDLLMAFKN